jgi:lipoyl(octanoyl) transferase
MQLIRAGVVAYDAAWAWQRELHEARVAGTIEDTVLLLEHESVYTAGRRTEAWERPSDGTPVIDVDRGGKITWHGPGQLTGYPIVALPEPVDVVGHVRRLEDVLLAVCDQLGVTAQRVEGRSGVWLPADSRRPERKVAAIGVRVARGVAMHGFALNCDCDLAAFDRIVPCGIRDAGVTSLSAELGRPVPVAEALPIVERGLVARMAHPPPYRSADGTSALGAAR